MLQQQRDPGLEMDPNEADNELRNFYCHWDSHNEDVLFSTAREFDTHLKDHYGQTMPNNTVACHWDACHEIVELDSIMEHIRNTHWKDSLYPHEECDPIDPTVHGAQTFHTTVPGSSTFDPDHSHLSAPYGYVRVHGHDVPPTNFKFNAPELPRVAQPDLATSTCCSSTPVTCLWVVDGQACGKLFSCSHDLNAHLDEDHIGRGQRSYVCQWENCPRDHRPFFQRPKAVRHLQVHAKNRDFKCQICGRFFNDEVALRQHTRLRLGEKPHVCDICGKGFAVSSSLTVHRRTHTGEKPLVCRFPGCNKRFSESSNLAKHMKTHGPKAYQCPVCSRKFARNDQLRRHINFSHDKAVRQTKGPPALHDPGVTTTVTPVAHNH